MKSFSEKKLVRRGCAFGALVQMFRVMCVAADPTVLDQQKLVQSPDQIASERNPKITMKQIMKLTLLVCALACSTGPAMADVIFQSALLGPTGQTGGAFISGPQGAFPGQFLGVRFHLDNPVMVDHIGGHFLGNADGSIFGAIVALGGASALPDSSPFAFTPLAEMNFAPSFPSVDALIPLSIALGPGDYGLIFGSDRFGATGTGHMPQNNLETGQATYFVSNGDQWLNAVPLHERFVVTGTLVPEPSTTALLGVGLVGILSHRLRYGRI